MEELESLVRNMIFDTGVRHRSGDRILLTRPYVCPHCRHGIRAENVAVYYMPEEYPDRIETVWACPILPCRRLFLVRHEFDHDFADASPEHAWAVKQVFPVSPPKKSFSKAIEQISQSFVDIYNQALAAESHGLSQICGAGYRRAIEFLVKDYLKLKHPDEAEEIERLWLKACIENYIDGERLKAAARRAAWLGNDEVHYSRKWEKKDLSDLKSLIEIMVHWINMEEELDRHREDMPDA